MSQNLQRLSLLTCLLAISSVGMIAFQQDDPDLTSKPIIKIQPKAQANRTQNDKPQLPKIIPAQKATPSQSIEEFAPLPSNEIIYQAIREVGKSFGWALLYDDPEEGLFIWRLNLSTCKLPQFSFAESPCEARFTWYVKRVGDSLSVNDPVSFTGISWSRLHSQLQAERLRNTLKKQIDARVEEESQILQHKFYTRLLSLVGNIKIHRSSEFHSSEIHSSAIKKTYELDEYPIVAGESVIVVSDNAQITVDGNAIEIVPRGWCLQVRGFEGDQLKVVYRRAGVIQRKNVMRLDQAIAHFTEELRRNPEDSISFVARANAAAFMGEAGAQEDYHQAIKLNPNLSLGYHQRGLFWGYRGRYEQAITDLTTALRLAPDKTIILYDRGVAYREQGDYDKSLEDLNASIQGNRQFGAAYRERSLVWSALGDDNKALADLGKAIVLDPEDAVAMLFRGLHWSRIGQEQRARQDIEKAVELNPSLLGLLIVPPSAESED